MAFRNVLVHRARLLRRRESGAVVHGDSSPVEELGAYFACCLFLPQGTEDAAAPRGGRQVRRPTLLIAPKDDGGAANYLGHEDEVGIDAPELGEALDLEDLDAVRARAWQVDGSPQPFGKPGRRVIGYQVALKRVED